MSFISYAQNFEDVMLWRALKHIETGFYIDVGANDPETDSVTKAFYNLGWRGINIEPVPQWFQRLQETRLRDINLQLALGSEPGEIILYEIPDTGLSTAEKAFAERHEAERGYQSRELKVPQDTLANICEQYHIAPIHFLKIDVEGMEKAVLEGADFTKIRPWIVLVESALPNTQKESHSEWEPILLDAGYHYVYGDGLNKFYVADEHSELLSAFQYPPNLFDDFILKRHVDTETRANNADSKAQAAELRTAEYEAEIQDTKERVMQAEARADDAEKDAEKAKILIRETQSQADKARALSTEADINAKNAATRAEKAETDLEQAENKAKKDQKLIEQLQSDLDYAKTQAEQIQEQLQEKDRALEAIQAEVAQLQAHSQWLQNEWDAAKAKNEELNHSSHHWWTVADGLNRELQSIYHSKFWSITWPLRKSMQWLKRIHLFLASLLTGLLRLPRKSLRWILTKTIRFTFRSKGFEYRARKWLMRHPKIKAHIRAFAHQRGLIPSYSAARPRAGFNQGQKGNDLSINAKEATSLRVLGRSQPMWRPSNRKLEIDELMARIWDELEAQNKQRS